MKLQDYPFDERAKYGRQYQSGRDRDRARSYRYKEIRNIGGDIEVRRLGPAARKFHVTSDLVVHKPQPLIMISEAVRDSISVMESDATLT